MCKIKEPILNLLRSHRFRLTPANLIQAVRDQNQNLPKKRIHAAIKDLVERGDLVYTHHFGLTQLELNFNRPVKISRQIILTPPHCTAPTSPRSIVIKLNSGASFGTGDHPTTRIALRGIEFVFKHEASSVPHTISALDIGTGSGVLAIAALKLGALNAIGLDLDPVARHEAKLNVSLNELEKSIAIEAIDLESLARGRFELIMANLRPPTLMKMIPQFQTLSTQSAYWILSGFRAAEKKDLISKLSSKHTKILWESSVCDWSGLVIEWKVSGTKYPKNKAQKSRATLCGEPRSSKFRPL